MTTENLLVELFVEELPPKALKKLGDAFASLLHDALRAQGLAPADGRVTSFATPRRLAVHLASVASQAADKAVSQKLMPVSVGLDPLGQATPALLKKLQALGLDASAVAQLKTEGEGKAAALMYHSVAAGATLSQGLQKALDEALSKLPIPKVMTYQLEAECELPGWTSVNFVRPVHALVALHGAVVVPVQALGLKAGAQTQGHRFEAPCSPVVFTHADDYAATLARDGAVIASFAERRADIVRQLQAAAARVGGGVRPIEDEALLDEVCALVERPHVLVCAFDEEFLSVPQECLILTMKANQKYFPLIDAEGRLTHRFLVVSNIQPEDASAVIGGNERVVRPRLADAKFFFDQDRKKTLASRVDALGKVVYHNKLGSQGERSARVAALAEVIAKALPDGQVDVAQVLAAAQLAKTDLLTDMVGEFPELQGVMGNYYAKADGLSEAVALAIEDHYRPRFAGDALPRNTVGVVVALADKLETLVGLFGIGQQPSGDRDPYALRRHALGVVRMLMELNLPLSLRDLVAQATPVFGALIADPAATQTALLGFIDDRLAGMLRDQGYSAQEVDAVLALHPAHLGEVPRRLEAVRAFAALPESAALAAANKRITNILRKTDDVLSEVDAALLAEAAERSLFDAMSLTVPQADQAFNGGDYTGSLRTLAGLRAAVDGFFDDVMVNAEDPSLRRNRLSLLKSLHTAMNRVADLSRLAS